MPLGSFAAFAAVDVLLVLTPGADWAFAIAAGLRGRWLLASVAGLATGYLIDAALVTLGVGTVVARSGVALSVLTAAGAAYLVGLGIAVAREPAPLVAATELDSSSVRAGLRGAAVSGLNPKGLFLFFAVMPQFVVSGAAWSATLQLAILGSFHVLACGGVYLLVALGARRLLGSRPAAARVLGRTSGFAMVVLGVVLIAERVLGMG
jgi:threonine/homoserine/homoserine lactone efflux protein